MFIKSLFLKFAAAIITLVMLIPAGSGKTAEYDVREPGSCKLNFTVLSDSHIEGNNFARYQVFVRALQNVKKNKSGNDAIVFLGDNTMNGQNLENMLFHGTAALILKDQFVLSCMGNHDIGNGEGDYEELQSRWYTYTNAFFDKQLTTPYYCDVINGYYFIVLGTEAHTSNTMTLSNAQLAWLREVLEEAAVSGKPTFVFSHHPERASYREDPSYPDTLTGLLTAFAQTNDLFYFSGHTHRTLTSSSIRCYYNFPEISLPCLTTLSGEKDNEITDRTGCGVEVEVYQNEVVIRGRNFYTGEWAADGNGIIEITFPLNTPAPGGPVSQEEPSAE